MTASSASKRKPKDDAITVPATFTLRPRRLKPRKDYLAAGCVPLDVLYAEFPSQLLPEIAVIGPTRLLGDHALMVSIAAADLTDEEMLGAGLVQERRRKSSPPDRSGIVTRQEAAEAYDEWRLRDKIVQFARKAAEVPEAAEKEAQAEPGIVPFPSRRQAKVPAVVRRVRVLFPGDAAAVAVNAADSWLLVIDQRLTAAEAAIAGAIALGGSVHADQVVGYCSRADLGNALAVLAHL